MKKFISCCCFVLITLAMVASFTEYLTPKAQNRYYILDRYLKENPRSVDVQVFGACHAYNSFDTQLFEARTGTAAFVYANPGEIFPVTYNRMAEQFRKHTPKVVLVEVWGINPYETYDTQENTLQVYLEPNVEMLAFTPEKLELLADFPHLDPMEMLFPITKYKERLLDGSLTPLDTRYGFWDSKSYAPLHYFLEMSERISRNGYSPHSANPLENYPAVQNTVSGDDILQIEPVIEKYIERIIRLCKENDVQLIFYRAPYISTKNELRKLNRFRQICQDNDVPFLDLEQEMTFDYTQDFYDLYHLSAVGAEKATEFLIPYITEAYAS